MPPEAAALGPARVLRLFATGWAFHLKTLSMSTFFILTSSIQPVIFASIAFFMFRAGKQAPTLLYAAIGAGLMGIWSATLFGSGGAIQWQRYQGTLELLAAAPVPLVLVLVPLTLATATIGVYSLTATLLWGWLLFDIPLRVVHPLELALAIPATVLGLGLLGLVLASSFVLYRHANALANLLEYPVWLVTGLLVPVSQLPGWTRPIAWALAPTWGVRAIREAALGGRPLPAIGACVALAAVYAAAGTLLLRYFDRLARDRATLALT
jgi:ABC-2 type transport system permease protein